MKIASENAAIALTQTSASAAAQKRRAAELDAAKVKPAESARSIVDTVELSEPKPAHLSRSDAHALPTPAQQPAAPGTVAPSTNAPADPAAELLKSFGLRSGDEGFNSALDANGDGVINFADLNASLTNPEPPTGGPSPVEPAPSASPASFTDAPADLPNPGDVSGGAGSPSGVEPQTGGPLPVEPTPGAANPASLQDAPADELAPAVDEAAGAAQSAPESPASFTVEDIERLLNVFGSAAGGERFDSTFDFDNDGVINFADLNELLNRVGQEPAQQQQSLLASLTDRFGATQGDDLFNPGLDFDNDGVINFGDLNTLLHNLAQSSAAND